METILAPASLIFSPHNLWFWIFTSLLFSALVNSLTWRLGPRASQTIPRPLRWALVLLREGGRFLYFVGLPYLALLNGLIPAAQAGLLNQDWLRDLTLALPLGAGAFLMLLFLRVLLLWRDKTLPSGPPAHFGVALRESAYQEIHWTFYRSAPLLAVDDPARGMALGLGIVALEAWLNPAWRERWRNPALALAALRTSALAVTMVVVFGIIGNLWLTLGLHVIVERASGWAWQRIAGASGQA